MNNTKPIDFIYDPISARFIMGLKEKFLLELDGLDLPWVKKNEHDSESSNLNWLPVAKLSGGRFLLGLTAEGDWARSTKSAVQTISDEAECVFFSANTRGPSRSGPQVYS